MKIHLLWLGFPSNQKGSDLKRFRGLFAVLGLTITYRIVYNDFAYGEVKHTFLLFPPLDLSGLMDSRAGHLCTLRTFVLLIP